MDEKKQLIIIGAGGHGSELYSYIRDLSFLDKSINFLGFIDEGKPPGNWGETQIIGNFDALKYLVSQTSEKIYYITAFGSNQIRKKIAEKIENMQLENLESFVLKHFLSNVGYDVEIGAGTCLAPGSIITTKAKIGKHCILNVKSSVSHDCIIDDFVNLNPNTTLCGNVKIGEGSYIGAGSTIIEKISIGKWSIIGAGSVVINDIPDYVTAVGVPAKIIKYHQEENS